MNTVNPGQILMQDYTYELPHAQIAAFPLEQRDASRLLVYEKGSIKDDQFIHIPHNLPPGATLVVNNTRVIEARLLFQKDTGGQIEIFCLEPHGQSIEEAMMQTGKATWKCLIGGASKWKPGLVLQKKIELEDGPILLQAHYIEKEEESFLIGFDWTPAELPFVQVLHATGAIPLPPYIKRSAQVMDSDRYQTVFSRHEGSVAAPTAALHFTQKQFEALKAKGISVQPVTLHVGAGTFKPVKSETIAGHHMHAEPFTVNREVIQNLLEATTIVAVGTTSLRTLESLYWIGVKLADPTSNTALELGQWEAYELEKESGEIPYRQSLQQILDWLDHHGLEQLQCRTSMIIVPGYTFRLPSALVTNFHQPGSTLLLLIAAFIGEDWRKVYQHALEKGYRFLSYGDSSLLWR